MFRRELKEAERSSENVKTERKVCAEFKKRSKVVQPECLQVLSSIEELKKSQLSHFMCNINNKQ